MPQAASPTSIMDAMVAAYNAKDFDKLRAIFSPKLYFQHHNRGFEFRERDGLLEIMRKFGAEIMPDRKFGPPVRTIESGNTVMREHRWGGVLRADVPGMGKAGERLELDLNTVLVVQDGVVTEYHDYG